MRQNKTYKQLSDAALERIMQDVLKGMQAFSAGLAKPTRLQTLNNTPAALLKTRSLPRFTSLRSVDLFGINGEADKPG